MDTATDFSAIPPDLLADAFEALSEGIAIYSADERLVVCNARYQELLGPMADMIVPGMHWRDLIHGCVQRGVLAETAEGGENWEDRFKRQRDGLEQNTEIRQLDGRTHQVSYRSTKSGGFVVTREDITEMRQAENMARDREALLKTILDTNPTPVVMGRLKDARVLYRSPAAAEVYGSEEYTTSYYRDHDERMAYVNALREHGRVEDFIIRARRADGSEGLVALSGGLTEYNGDLCAVSSVTDLTERIEREELIRKVVESCPAPVLMNRAATGEILYKSPELIALFGDGDRASDFYVDPADRDGFLAAVREMGEVSDYRSRFRNAAGEEIWVAVSARLIFWDGEEVIVSYAR
ncbi:MAG: PAS-domain containing protein, partial [Pseudomonadota bacterium]